MPGFSPDKGTIDISYKEVRLSIIWKSIDTGGCEIQGRITFRGKVVKASATPEGSCRRSNIRSVISDLVAKTYDQSGIDEYTADLLRLTFREIRHRLADDFGIT